MTGSRVDENTRPTQIEPSHYTTILRNNQEFVHWLSPLDTAGLTVLLGHADYARQIADGQAAAIGYDGGGAYRHKHVDYLSTRLSRYFYVDRIIIGAAAQGQGLGQALYTDIQNFAWDCGYTHIACEVNTQPDNPGSHAFHRALGFAAFGDADYDDCLSVRYYVRKLPPKTEKPLAAARLPA